MFCCMKRDKNGTLNYSEFESLLNTIVVWKVSGLLEYIIINLDPINMIENVL